MTGRFSGPVMSNNNGYTIGIYSSHFTAEKVSNSHSQKQLLKAVLDMGHNYKIMRPSKWTFFVSNEKVMTLYNDAPPAIDGLIIRGTSGAKVPTSLLANSLWYQKVPTIDKRQAFSGQYMTKYGALLRRYAHLKEYVPPTFLLYSRESAYKMAKEGILCPPVVRKPIQGTGGAGIKILHNTGDIINFLDNYDWTAPLLFQKYIKAKQEYRSIVVGNECLGIVKKVHNENGLGNFSQGAQFIRSEKHLYDEIKAISLDIAQKSPYDIIGIDLLREASGRYYIIEANRNPQYKGFETVYKDVNVAESIVSLMIKRIERYR